MVRELAISLKYSSYLRPCNSLDTYFIQTFTVFPADSSPAAVRWQHLPGDGSAGSETSNRLLEVCYRQGNTMFNQVIEGIPSQMMLRGHYPYTYEAHLACYGVVVTVMGHC